jgi:hypothetical protein
MDTTLQKCNVCGAVNDTKANTWVRIFGATLGRTNQPIQIMGAGALMRGARPTVDFCPACAAKTTADKIPGLFPAAVTASLSPRPAGVTGTVPPK